MRALLKYDWHKSGLKITAACGFIAVMVILFYFQSLSFIIGFTGFDKAEIFYLFYGTYLLPIWGLPVITVCISGRMIDDDRRSGWYRLSISMPFTRRQYISEKYLFGLICMGVCIVYVMLIQTVYVIILNVFDIRLLMLFFLRYLMVFAAVSSVITFLSVWKSFGAALLVAVMLLMVLPLVLTIFLAGYDESGKFLTDTFINMIEEVSRLFYDPDGIVCGSITAVVMYALSYFLSLEVFERSDV